MAYNPMQSVRALSGLQLSGQGLAWEGKERGLGRQAIQRYLNEQARAATKAGSGIGLANILGKGAGLLTMFATGGSPVGIAAGSALSGAISGFGGSFATRGLSRGGAPDVLYGRAEAEEAESYAHQAIDTLMGSVVPKALTTAITTPLEYMTLKNTFTPREKVTEEVAKVASKTAGVEASKYAVGDMGKLFAAGQEKYKQKGFLDLLSLARGGTRSGGDIPFVPATTGLGTNISNYFNNPYLRL